MASKHNPTAVPADQLITIKISVNDSLKKFKLPLSELPANKLPAKLRQVLDIKPEQTLVLERYSDSAAGYITLDESNPQVFKTLIRAAKAKLKLRLKATVTPVAMAEQAEEKKTVPEELPAQRDTPRSCIAFDQRSIGQFREALASQQTLVNEEAPFPQPSENRIGTFFPNGAPTEKPLPLAFRMRQPTEPAPLHTHPWSVYCNACDKAMDNEHFHCSICDGGDYDLCQDCVTKGELCPGDGHWLIKRFIQDGKVINSTTERVSPRKVIPISAIVEPKLPVESQIPTSDDAETKTLTDDMRPATRTCNNCVLVLNESYFVTCTSCDDFDLCIKCHVADNHGHHPAHGFKPATEETVLPMVAETKLAPGRNVRHNAICDSCDKKIYGVRHKCLNCPDWDYCNDCIKDARQTHPHHRFAALYQPIADQSPSMVRHFGIYCDGPLCNKKADQSYIQGVRYKCTICHDTDFCAACEALPSNHHNRTHPLIKLKTQVRNVNVSTQNEDVCGHVRVMGDRGAQGPIETKSAATETTPVQQTNAATQVQTVAEFKPTELKKEEVQPVPIPVKAFAPSKVPAATVPDVSATMLNAHFVRDSVADGMVLAPEACFTQTWTLKNPGPHAWPAGCSVRYVGGDNMLNVDNSHPASVTAIADATESNVVGREVLVGEEVAFKVTLIAPVREGKAISYWRLKAADGTPFGHRLWCDIEVKQTEKPVEVPVRARDDDQRALLQRMRMQQTHMARVVAQQQQQRPQQQSQRSQIQQQNAELQQQFLQHQMMRMQQQAQMQQAQPAPSLSQLSRSSFEQPAHDSANLSARLAVMREQQKQRREQMMAQLSAQRDQLQAQGSKREDTTNLSQHYQTNPSLYAGSKATEGMSERERREALKQRVAYIKANILKSREERERLAEDFKQKKTVTSEEQIFSDKVKKLVEEVSKQAEQEETEEEEKDECEDEEQLEGSQMVFPKLEKESPTSSTYESATSSSHKGKAAYVENEDGEIERSATPSAAPLPVPSSPTEEDFVDLDDEIEVLSALGNESDDDGFLTDEEYDILDADDQETVASR